MRVLARAQRGQLQLLRVLSALPPLLPTGPARLSRHAAARALMSSAEPRARDGVQDGEILRQTGKPLWRVDISTVNTRDWDVVCDARAPCEYEEDHAPGSLNFPVLNDVERAEVGTLHKQASSFEARRRGAALVAQNLHAILSSPPFAELGPDARVLVYCARGGERSRSLAYVLSRVGWTVGVVDGGYRSYRAHVRKALQRLGDFEYHLISGPTGSAKGKMLDELEACGAQVIDLEGLANHKGSILGDNPNSPQPSQKKFESMLAARAATLDPRFVVFVESESNLVGKLHVPPELFGRMRVAPRTSLSLPMAARVAWIRAGYSHFETTHVGELRSALEQLVRLRGRETVSRWQALVSEGQWDAFVQSLLEEHYDPAYAKSRDVFYGQGGDVAAAPPSSDVLELPDWSDGTYRQAALQLLERHGVAGRAAGPARAVSGDTAVAAGHSGSSRGHPAAADQMRTPETA